jgi:hypothetical protein
MPLGRVASLRRLVGLALARHLLRRCLAVQGARGQAALATVIARPRPADDNAGAGVSVAAAYAPGSHG